MAAQQSNNFAARNQKRKEHEYTEQQLHSREPRSQVL